ncbi:MFS transporter [Amycolatopsis rhabdoformis]|uniref:MFS transporter n=1 Tax=Amycolatopsis rhabdoformis TaxID=1448059 RepID=A0ABZ1IDX1_9PSEU|nr:MFS transporter [Amycolatopsis rhabdoformis]WSE32353.1 MFS transporter [Amycolatopsis rhabdoformis]
MTANPEPIERDPARARTLGEPAFEKVSTRDIKRSTVIGWVAGIVAVYDFILFGTLLPRIAATFGWSESFALLVSTLVSVGTAVALFAIGPIVDRIGRRRGMIATVSGTAIASAVTAATGGATSLVAVRSISGLSLSEQSVNATYLNELYAAAEDERVSKHRGFVFSMVQTAWPLGALAAAGFVALVSLFLDASQWRWVFLLATVPAILVALLCRKLRESPQFLAQRGAAKQRSAPLSMIFKRAQLRNTVVLALGWLTNWMAIQTFSVLGTTVLESGKGFSSSNSLLLVVASNLVAALGYLAHGWLGDRFPRHRVIAVGWTVAAAMFTLMLLGPNNVGFVLVTYMIGLFFLLGPYATLLVFQSECYTTECRATGGAFAFAMSQPGAILGGLLLSALTGLGWGYGPAALVVGAGGCLISGLLMLAGRNVAARAITGA